MQTIGRYVIESRIGSGGLGVIYRARDPHLGRDVAIKVMSAGSSREPDLVVRFEREARTAAALAHRNIVTIHEFGIHDGDPFIVMELLGGTDLHDRLSSAPPLSVREKLSIATQIGDALAFAHGRGVVHRDLKPSNIRLLPDGTVKLMDFGLAYIPASTLTKTGELFGTVAFLAPEQLRGSKGGPRSDIFSLGVILFELFEGRLPFEAGSSPDLIRQLLDHPPRAAQWLPRHPELHRLVLRALDKEPARRWQSVTELLDALHTTVIPSMSEGPGRPDPAIDAESIPTIPGDTPIELEPTLPAIALPSAFTPGTIIGGRYRIVALLGSGGMGEVYRADDLRLGQRIALKFLAPHLAADPARLERLYAEVRLGRQVSHPNVCRIYDIGDAGGHPFIAMQYVEGEDLGSLLRRVGRLSLEKSLDIARDICSGLAAAHSAGVIHRDLKPSNIMIDAQGRAILLDFGLAEVSGSMTEERASGSLHYASPEQIAGRGTSIASDLYSLGLVLYELLTSRRAFDGETLAEVSAARASHRITAPSVVRAEVPGALDRVILRCLSLDPAERPSTTREILAVLPGGDPVSAAIAAGETPSPDVIAAAGLVGDLTRPQAWTAVAIVALLATLMAVAAPAIYLHHRVPFDERPEVLASAARRLAVTAGYDISDGDSTYTLVPHDEEPQSLRIHLVWRYSPQPLQSRTVTLLGRVTATDPPLDLPGMLLVELDTTAKLVKFMAVSPQVATPASGVDWSPLLQATGCGSPKEIAPRWTPPVASDSRRAWQCRVVWASGLPFGGRERQAGGPHYTVEAASFAGRPVWLEVIGPHRTSAPALPRRHVRALSENVYRLIVFGVILGAGFVARRNLVRGRGDRRRAFRVAAVVIAGAFGEWLIATRHVGSLGREWDLFVTALGRALFFGGLVWVVYMAAEPYVRRQWPRVVTSWYRFFDGRFRDPLVGRDVLFGVAGGAALQLIERGVATIDVLRGAAPVLFASPVPHLTRVADAVALLFRFPNRAIWNALGSLIVLLLLRALVRHRAAAVVLWIAVITAMNLDAGPPLAMEIGFTLLFVIGLLVIMLRVGLFALTVALLTHYTFGYFVPVFDFSTWYGWRTILGWLVIAALTAYGFIVALAGKGPFGRSILEE